MPQQFKVCILKKYKWLQMLFQFNCLTCCKLLCNVKLVICWTNFHRMLVTGGHKIIHCTVLWHCAWNVVMATLWNRAGHYIFVLWFLSSFFYLFFPRLISSAADWCLPYFHTWCGPSANLECRSEMCCTRLAGNTWRKNRHFGTIAQLCWAISSELRHVLTIGKKLVKQQNPLRMSS